MVFSTLDQASDSDLASEHIVGCDGISALFKSITSNKERLKSWDDHFDKILAIIGFCHNMNTTPFPVHVRGHRDDALHIDSLPRLAKMNIHMDSMAKNILEESLAANTAHPCPEYTFGLPVLSCHGVCIESNLVKSATDTISAIGS